MDKLTGKNTFAAALGANIRNARKLVRQTQADLAKHLGISRPYVTMIEGGQYSTNPIDAHRVFIAASFLGVPITALYPVVPADGEMPLLATTKLGKRVVKALTPALAGLPGLALVESEALVEIHLAELPLSRLGALQGVCYQSGLDLVMNGSGKSLVLYVAEG